jgi:hypothetical protein
MSALVLRVGLAAYRRLPLYPRQRTSSGRLGRSEKCQEQSKTSILPPYRRNRPRRPVLRLRNDRVETSCSYLRLAARKALTLRIASARASGLLPTVGECPSGGSLTFVRTRSGRLG